MQAVGFDIGSRADHTALLLAVQQGDRVEVPRVEQMPLRLGYEAIVHRAAAWGAEHPAARILGDATGVGAPLLSSLSQRLPGRVVPVIFTGGKQQRQAPDGVWSVPKAHLVQGLVSLVSCGRLTITASGAGRDALRQELAAFIARPRRTGFAFEAGRGHDDLVMALALAVAGVLSQR